MRNLTSIILGIVIVAIIYAALGAIGWLVQLVIGGSFPWWHIASASLGLVATLTIAWAIAVAWKIGESIRP